MVIFTKILFGILISAKHNGNEEELLFVTNNNDVAERNYFNSINGFIFIQSSLKFILLNKLLFMNIIERPNTAVSD